MKQNFDTKRLVLTAMLAAVSYMMVMLIRIPVVDFLKYEPKDVAVVIGGFLYGPVTAAVISLVVSLLEMVTISETGPIGCLMNFLSTCSFACITALVYQKNRSRKGALLGLLAGSCCMVAVMLLWNWLVTPLYLHVPRPAVEAMLLPVFLPFNVLKAGLNSAITLLIYKPLVQILRRMGMLPPSPQVRKNAVWSIPLLSVLLLAGSVLLLLILRGIL